MEITKLEQLDLPKQYSYADYLQWKFRERVELIKGKILVTSPAPGRKHQSIAGNLHFVMRKEFNTRACNLYFAPFDVRLPRSTQHNENIYTVVQPDLCVVCDEAKLDDRGCIGAPDLVAEILSPGNSSRELKLKFDLYEETGVREYWVINPSEETVLVNVLNDEGKYKTLRPIVDDYIVSEIFPDIKIRAQSCLSDSVHQNQKSLPKFGRLFIDTKLITDRLSRSEGQ